MKILRRIVFLLAVVSGTPTILENGDANENTGQSFQNGGQGMSAKYGGDPVWGSLYLTSGVPWVKQASIMPKRGGTPKKTIRNITKYNDMQKISRRRKRSVAESPSPQCPAGETCKNVCFDRNFNYTNCYCDIGCLLFGDCCFDFFEVCLNTSVVQLLESVAGIEVTYHNDKTSNIPTDYSDVSVGEGAISVQNCSKPLPNDLNEIRPEDIMTLSGCIDCVGVTNWGGTKDVWSPPAYQIVSRCPETWTNQGVRHLCENQTAVTFNNPPVHDGSGGILSFRNLHCAMCHGRSVDELQPWNITLTCPETDDIDTWIKEDQFIHSCCRFLFKPLTDLKDATRRCLWNVSDQNASSVWMSINGKRKCNGDDVTFDGKDELSPIGGFGIFNAPEEDSVTKDQKNESLFWGPLGSSKKLDTHSKVGMPKQSDVDLNAKDPAPKFHSVGTFGFFKPLGNVPNTGEETLKSSFDLTRGLFGKPNGRPTTKEPTWLSTVVGKFALPEPVDSVSSTAEQVLESFVGTFGFSKSPNAVVSTGIPAQNFPHSTQQTVEDLLQRHTHPARSTQTSYETVSFDGYTVRQHDAYNVSFSNISALGPYKKWCDFFGSLSQDGNDESGPCHCLGSKDLKAYGDDEPSLMVPLSALFTLDPNYGVKVTFLVQDVFTSVDIIDDYGQCSRDTIFMTDTKRCEASVCDVDFLEDPGYPCLIDSSDHTFPPEGNFTSVVSIEVSILLYKTEMEQTAESVDVRRIFSCFLETFDQSFVPLNVFPGELVQEWTRVRKGASMEYALVKSSDFSQKFAPSGNKSSCREINLSQRHKTARSREYENLTSYRYEQEVVTLLKFRRAEVLQIWNLLVLLGAVTPRVYLDEFTLRVFNVSSVIVRNFNQSTDVDCDGELKMFNITESAERNSDYWIALPQTRGNSYLRYSEIMMRNEFIYEKDASAISIGRGIVCQRLGNLTGYKNCTVWIGVPHSAQISNGRELFVEINGFEHKVSQFLNTSSKLFVCKEGLQRLIKSLRTEYDKAELILNYTGFSLSLVALFLTFLTYLLIQTLRNLPGKIVMCFSLTMFSAILLFMVLGGRVYDETLCSAVAIVLHFLWLSAFLWVNTLSFDVSRAFSGNGNNAVMSDCGQSKRLMAYMFYALGIPTLIVGSTVAEGLLSNPGSGVGGAYGNRRLCWIRGGLAVYVFYCPVGITLVINLLLFVRSARGIHAVSRLAKAVSLKSDKPGNAFLFVKLSLVMGLSWLLFYLIEVISNQVVRLLCSTVNSLQGIFVFLAFVCNKRVWRYYRKLFRRGKRSAEEKTAVSDVSSKSPKRQTMSSF